MSNDLTAVLESETKKLAELQRAYESQLAFVKRLAEIAGQPIPEDVTSIGNGQVSTITTPLFPPPNTGGNVSVKTGEFFNMSLTEATKIYLDRKGGAAPFPEILDALKRGGFGPATKGEAEAARLRLNLLKSANFVLIPENNFGLTSQYGKPKRKIVAKPKKKKGKPATPKATTEKPKGEKLPVKEASPKPKVDKPKETASKTEPQMETVAEPSK